MAAKKKKGGRKSGPSAKSKVGGVVKALKKGARKAGRFARKVESAIGLSDAPRSGGKAAKAPKKKGAKKRKGAKRKVSKRKKSS